MDASVFAYLIWIPRGTYGPGVAPEIHLGMREVDYFEAHGINSSTLKEMIRSPLHYWAKKNEAPKKPTPAQMFGRHLHVAVHEPERFAREFERLPDGFLGSRKPDKQLKSEIEDAGKIPVSPSDFDAIEKCVESIMAHPFGRALRRVDTHAEASLFWDDEITGARCKARLDEHTPPCDQFPHGMIWDLKSTDDAREPKFQRTIRKFEYDLSAAFYCDGVTRVYGGTQRPAFYWMVIERKAPHAVAIYEASEEYIARGRMAYEGAMARVMACESSDEWDSYHRNRVRTISPPAWDLAE